MNNIQNTTNKTKIFEEYIILQKKSEKKNFNIQYYILGLFGEIGEVLNELKKFERDDNYILTKKRKNNLISELGDCIWYISAICNKIDYNISNLLNEIYETSYNVYNDLSYKYSQSNKVDIPYKNFNNLIINSHFLSETINNNNNNEDNIIYNLKKKNKEFKKLINTILLICKIFNLNFVDLIIDNISKISKNIGD